MWKSIKVLKWWELEYQQVPSWATAQHSGKMGQYKKRTMQQFIKQLQLKMTDHVYMCVFLCIGVFCCACVNACIFLKTVKSLYGSYLAL